jgi:hypothetical protein
MPCTRLELRRVEADHVLHDLAVADVHTVHPAQAERPVGTGRVQDPADERVFGVSLEPPQIDDPDADVVLALRLRDGARELAWLSTVSTFGTAVDVTLAELSIEAFYPADDETPAALLGGRDQRTLPPAGT